jgi:isopentenyl diphosphate isomerase/L-lactate dehydrogenase-like FMN-dependent dehydrogenase
VRAPRLEATAAEDYVALAAAALPVDRHAYLDGGAGAERTLAANRRAFERWMLLPRQLPEAAPRGGGPDTAVTLWGRRHALPVWVAPVAWQTLWHPHGEIATAHGAAAADVTMVLSALSSHTPQDVAAATPAPKWLQIGPEAGLDGEACQGEQGGGGATAGATGAARADSLLARIREAESLGFEGLVLTLDAAIQQPSRRALEAGFRMPSEHARTGQPGLPRLPGGLPRRLPGNPGREWVRAALDATRLPVLAKGVLDPADAVWLREAGAAGVVVSNHGGRTVDGVCASLPQLPAVRQAVGDDWPVLLDSGIRSGWDVFTALALGADAVLMGRLPLFGLGVAGALGVAHALRLTGQELQAAMAVTGCASVADIRRHRPVVAASP